MARPVNLLMSGPVAGVVGGIWAGRQAGFTNVITLDVGGTSADIGVAQDGRLRMKHLLDTKVGPYQAMVPMVDVDTIGAGGGSIVYVDQGGIFRVGPRSAGAKPGPACYMLGGTEPTATDAMVNLGWLRPEAFLGGGMDVAPDLAHQAFAQVTETLNMSVEEASLGAVQVLSHLMVQAIEQNSVRKGFDPRDFALVAEGGAGPLFSAQIGVEVGTPFVIIPPFPGITSAMGLLATDMVYEYGATVYQRASQVDMAALQSSFEQLERQAQQQLESDGAAAEDMVVQRICECRYLGQGYELRVDAPSGDIDDAWLKHVRTSFNVVHEREYSRSFPDADIEIPNIRVRGVGLMPDLQTPAVETGTSDADQALREAASVFRALGDVRGETSAIINRAIVERRRGRLESSRECCVEALGMCVALGHAEGQVDCLDVVAAIEVGEGHLAAGLRLFEIVGAARRRLGLEVSTPDERRDREAAVHLARASLDAPAIHEIELASATVDITVAAIAELEAVGSAA